MTIAVALAADGLAPPDIALTFSNNATWFAEFAWLDGGQAADLTGLKLRMQVRAAAEDPTVVVELATDNGRLLVIPPDAQGRWNISAELAAVKDIKPGAYVYDVLAISKTDARVWRRQKGALTVEQGVTH